MHSYIIDAEFLKALNNLLVKEYKFRCNKKINRLDINEDVAKNFYWSSELDELETDKAESDKIDEYLFIIYSRLNAVASCSEEMCDQDLLYNAFPVEVIQAIDYMMPYFKFDNKEGMTWFFEPHVLNFIEKYKKKYNKFNKLDKFPSWSPDHYEPYPGSCKAYT